MSLYNLINGVNPATFLVLPMLGKHPDYYPRFRNCFTNDLNKPEYKDNILVYMRIGGNNREDYQEQITELRKFPEYITDYDDEFDSTYASFVFKIPEQYKKDYKKIKFGKTQLVSKKYQEQLISVYPKLEKQLRDLFKKSLDK